MSVPRAVIPDIFNRESILVFPTQETLGGGTRLLCRTNGNVQTVIGDAGVRPGSRGPFLSGKGPKTMLAVAWPCGHTRQANTPAWLIAARVRSMFVMKCARFRFS